MVNDEAGAQWCALVRDAYQKLGVQWFGLWLGSVSAGPGDLRLSTGGELLKFFAERKQKHDREALFYAAKARQRKP